MIMESVGQGITLAGSLTALGLQGNAPVRGLVVAKQEQQPFNIEGAKVTVIGPLQRRLDKLRAEWAKALQKPTKEARQAALQELFLPQKLMDSAVANLSSIVVLVDIAGKKLLLTGDAQWQRHCDRLGRTGARGNTGDAGCAEDAASRQHT